jgi:hypothetical protein
MASPNLRNGGSAVARYSNGDLGTTAWGDDLFTSSGPAADGEIAKVVNLTVTCLPGALAPIKFYLAIFDTSGETDTQVAQLFTDLEIHPGNTLCLLDERAPIILNENYTLKAYAGGGSGGTLNVYVAWEIYS